VNDDEVEVNGGAVADGHAGATGKFAALAETKWPLCGASEDNK
jgi:hypothetical protein